MPLTLTIITVTVRGKNLVGTVLLSIQLCFVQFWCEQFWFVQFWEVQGDPNQNLLFQLALSLNVGIPDPKLVKPKCVWEVEVFCVKSKFLEKLEKNKDFHQK